MRYEILNCLKGFAAFWRFIMNSLTYLLKITAIALNTYFSAWLLLFVCSGYGGHPLSLYACLSCILICAVPPVTLITIALTFHKNRKILNSVLTIIAIISRRPASSVFSPGLRPGAPKFAVFPVNHLASRPRPGGHPNRRPNGDQFRPFSQKKRDKQTIM